MIILSTFGGLVVGCGGWGEDLTAYYRPALDACPRCASYSWYLEDAPSGTWSCIACGHEVIARPRLAQPSPRTPLRLDAMHIETSRGEHRKLVRPKPEDLL